MLRQVRVKKGQKRNGMNVVWVSVEPSQGTSTSQRSSFGGGRERDRRRCGVKPEKRVPRVFLSLSSFALFARPFVGLVVSESTQQKVEKAVVEPTGVVHRTGVSLASMLLMKKLGAGVGDGSSEEGCKP